VPGCCAGSAPRVGAFLAFKVVLAAREPSIIGPAGHVISLQPQRRACLRAFSFLPSTRRRPCTAKAPKALRKVCSSTTSSVPLSRGNCPAAGPVTSARVDDRYTPHPRPLASLASAAGDGHARSRAPRALAECPSSRMSSGQRTARGPAPRLASMTPPSRSPSRAGRSRGRAKRSRPRRYRT
jgi:hypothetical protein